MSTRKPSPRRTNVEWGGVFGGKSGPPKQECMPGGGRYSDVQGAESAGVQALMSPELCDVFWNMCPA